MRRIRVVMLGLLGILFMLAACAAQNAAPSATTNNVQQATQMAYAAMPTALPTAAAPADSALERQAEPGQTVNQPEQQRVVLYSASLTIIVDDPEARLAAIATMTSEMGGWVVSSNVSQVRLSNGEAGAQGTITLRIPAARLDEALTQIKADVTEVQSEMLTGEDVTSQYIDISSRLANLEAAESQLQDILDRAETTEDVLNVFNELTRIRGEIEALRGQINYYDQASAFSSVTVTIRQTPPEPVIELAGWQPGDTARDAVQTLIDIVQAGVDLLIVLAIVGLPLALLVALPAWLVWRRVRRAARTAG
jgi:hypothetical protein